MARNSPTSWRQRWRSRLRRLRCFILPPKNAVFLDGRWYPAVPAEEGPAIATFAGRDVPEWWMLECGRVAEFVGVYDGRPLFFRQPPTRPGEVIIDQAIYRVSVRPRVKSDTDACAKAA